jgi:single-strand DNA-binding protein
VFETNLTVVGKVISDLNHSTSANGFKRCGFRIKAWERRYDKEAGEWVDGDRVFLQVMCWRRLAEGVAASLRKGDYVVVTGKLAVREWETDGQQRSMVELEARAVGPDLSRCSVEVNRPKWDDDRDRARELAGPAAAAA